MLNPSLDPSLDRSLDGGSLFFTVGLCDRFDEHQQQNARNSFRALSFS